MKMITITFRDGKSTIATEGFVGTDCQRATAQFEAILGNKTADKLTAEATAQGATHGNLAKH